MVKEEISVGKRKVQETETVRDTVRREEARIEGKGCSAGARPVEGEGAASPAGFELYGSGASHRDHLI